VAPVTTGHDLRDRGLPASPRYKQILSILRDAWLDGKIHSVTDERALLDQLLADPERTAQDKR
jgi:hypothetical protein